MKFKSTFLFSLMTIFGLFYTLSDDNSKAYAAEVNTNSLEVLDTKNESIEPRVLLTRHWMELTITGTTGTPPKFMLYEKVMDKQLMGGWLEMIGSQPTGNGMNYFYRGYLYNLSLGPPPMPHKIEPEVLDL